MKVLITGGAGFIGSHLCDDLVELGYEVTVIDNLDRQVHSSGEWPKYLNKKVKKIKGDIRDRSIISAALKDCRVVIHLAAAVGVGQSQYQIEEYTSVNCLGTAILLEEIIKLKQQIKRIVVASSMSVYGEGMYKNINDQIVFPKPRSIEQLKRSQWELMDSENQELSPIKTDEKKPLMPESIYAINKRDQEEMCIAIGKAYSIPVTAFRMFNVYGTRQSLSNPYTGVVAIFASKLLKNQRPVIFEDGNQIRDFIHIKDVTKAYVKALEINSHSWDIYNLGSGETTTVKDIAILMSAKLDMQIKPIIDNHFRSGDIRHCFANIKKINKELEWYPSFSFSLGLDSMIEWLKKETIVNDEKNSYTELVDKGLIK